MNSGLVIRERKSPIKLQLQLKFLSALKLINPLQPTTKLIKNSLLNLDKPHFLQVTKPFIRYILLNPSTRFELASYVCFVHIIFT
jgi:hypothetical protein